MPLISLCLVPGLSEIPPGYELICTSFEEFSEGDVVLEGIVGLALTDVFCPFETEYLLTDEGVAYWDNNLFTGLKGRVQVIKQGNQLVALQDPNCGCCPYVECYFHPQYKEKHTDVNR